MYRIPVLIRWKVLPWEASTWINSPLDWIRNVYFDIDLKEFIAQISSQFQNLINVAHCKIILRMLWMNQYPKDRWEPKSTTEVFEVIAQRECWSNKVISYQMVASWKLISSIEMVRRIRLWRSGLHGKFLVSSSSYWASSWLRCTKHDTFHS